MLTGGRGGRYALTATGFDQLCVVSDEATNTTHVVHSFRVHV